MSIASMALFTGAFAWVLTRPLIEPVYRAVLIPGLDFRRDVRPLVQRAGLAAGRPARGTFERNKTKR
jgi:hypothetical protein